MSVGVLSTIRRPTLSWLANIYFASTFFFFSHPQVTTSGVGTIFTILIIVAHFDTIAFPDFWKVVFQDGSRYEQYICITSVLYWAAAIHINTSTLSVGEVQANVFFTTWIAFLSSVLNFGVWRVAAGKRSIGKMSRFSIRPIHRKRAVCLSVFRQLISMAIVCLTLFFDVSIDYFCQPLCHKYRRGIHTRTSKRNYIQLVVDILLCICLCWCYDFYLLESGISNIQVPRRTRVVLTKRLDDHPECSLGVCRALCRGSSIEPLS